MVIPDDKVNDIWWIACGLGDFTPVRRAIQLVAAHQIGYNAGHSDGYFDGRNSTWLKYEDIDDTINY